MESKPIPRGAWSSKTCDTCKSSTALLFCRPHALFLCLPCDSTLHHAPPSHSPEHHAPPSHLPKAHSLFLCLPCDSTLHAPPSHSPEAHALFPCLPCDSTLHHAPEVHAPSSHSPEAHAPPYHAPEAHAPPHARVWLCEVCEHAPAMVSCKADNAALCAACDSDIHSANPLARRHLRRPVTPFFRTPDAEFSLSGDDVAIPLGDDVAPGIGLGLGLVGNDDVAIANCPRWADGVAKREADLPCGDFLFCDADGFLDFDGNGMDRDSVVPVQSMRRYEEATTRQILNQLSSKYSAEIDFTNSKFNSIDDHSRSFVSHSFSQSISSSSMDVGVVPDGSSLSDMSYPYVRPCGTTGSIGTTVSQKSDREAKVMRYREKRKNRKFEKTIRYASRKAYAETRPRIKGRFAKRSVTEPESINEMFIPNSSAFMADIAGYGIVPSF